MTDNKDSEKGVVVAGVNLSEHALVLDRELPQYARGHFNVVPKALIRDPELSSDAKILWQIINDYAGTNRLAFPSHSTLAKDMGKSVASIKRYIDELIRNRWLTAQNRIGTSNYYYCAMPMEHYKAFDNPVIEGNYVPSMKRVKFPELPQFRRG